MVIFAWSIRVSPWLISPEESSSALESSDLVRFNDGEGTKTVSESWSSGVWSLDAVAVLLIDPAVTSEAVTTYAAEQLSEFPGASVAGCTGVQDNELRPGKGSAIKTLVRLAVPPFVAVKL